MNFRGGEYYDDDSYVYGTECDYSSPRLASIYWSNATCPARVMVKYSLNAIKTVHNVGHIFWTIVPTVFLYTIARAVTQLWPKTRGRDSIWRFFIEFIIIIVPSILCVNVINRWVETISFVLLALLLVVTWCGNCFQKAQLREFKMSRRLPIVTLMRSATNLLTALCILAIDFKSFPRSFRKTRTFGVGLMDVGIGLFVFSMGAVSRRPRKPSDFGRLMRMVVPIITLGLARTVVITYIDYNQDEHEYGVHLNAFFTLGFTKFFGTLLSATATSDKQLLPLGIVTLVIHEIILQLGIYNFVMDPEGPRTTFWSANREGIFSLPGFVGLYLVSMSLAHWLQTEETLNFHGFLNKLKKIAMMSLLSWPVLIACTFTVGVARVTCNLGYAVWIMSFTINMLMLFMFVFEFVLNTILPINSSYLPLEHKSGDMLQSKSERADTSDEDRFNIPTILEAVNRNGLLFFLVANVLTGAVNIFLAPEHRTSLESVLILLGYLLVATGFIHILYRLRIRIA